MDPLVKNKLVRRFSLLLVFVMAGFAVFQVFTHLEQVNAHVVSALKWTLGLLTVISWMFRGGSDV